MRILFAGLAGAIAMFIWSAIAHMATPLATIGVSTLPNQSVTVDNLASSIGDRSGLYLFPTDMDGGTPKASAAEGPGGFLVYNAHSPFDMSPKQLTIEFLTELAESLIAAWLLAQTALAAYGMRVGFVTTVGVLGAIVTNIPYWNWYAFPFDYTLAYSAIEVIAFLVAGLAISAILPARTRS